MAKGKEASEFVLIKDHPTLVAALSNSSADMEGSITGAIEAAGLHEQKHDLIAAAMDNIKTIQADMRDLRGDLPIKSLPGRRKAPAVKPFVARKKAPSPEEEHEFVQRSQKALQHLQRNLSDLKSELRKV